tara:strand:+ start:15371 stop:16240 length:870 start_codon:yes stop_codon:yes gene_type:complete
MVSVIITCYNQENTIADALISIRRQTYSNFECIVVDDGSSDNSVSIIESIIKEDKRFFLVKQPTNKGVAAARNLGIENSKGDFIQFLDGDDYLEAEKLSISHSCYQNSLSERKFFDIIFCDFKMLIDNNGLFERAFCKLNGNTLNFQNVLFKWDEGFAIPIHTGFLRRAFIGDLRFDEDLRSKEDWLFWIRLFKRNPKIYFIDDVLAVYRRHNSSITMSSSMYEDHILVINKIKLIIAKDEWNHLIYGMFQRYYKRSIYFKNLYLKKQSKSVWMKMKENCRKVLKKCLR